MATLQIRHLVAMHPRGASLRKRRERKLKPIRPSRKNELWYRQQLVAVVNKLRAAGKKLADKIRPRWPIVTDAPPSDVAEAIREASHGFGAPFEKQAAALANAASLRNLGEVDDRLARAIRESVSVDVRGVFSTNGKIAHVMEDATRWNTELITSIPEQYFERLRESISSAWADGMRWEDMTAEIARLGDVTEERAKVIARDQTAKMNSAFNQARQQQVGIAKYEWSTSEDERVRDSHAELDGQVFSWDEPGPCPGTIAGEPCYPGEDILCRCVAIPYVDLDEMEAGVAAMEAEQEESVAA